MKKMIVPLCILLFTLYVEIVGVASANELRDITTAAKHGDKNAQLALGLRQLSGQSVPRDVNQALVLLQVLAEEQDPRACLVLSVVYGSGFGVVKDVKKSEEWRRYSSLAFGHYVPQDTPQMLQWLRNAAEQGGVFEQFMLGWMYEIGTMEDGVKAWDYVQLTDVPRKKAKGVAHDRIQAMKWYQKAADQGLAEAQYRLGMMFISQDGGVSDGSNALLSLRKAAEQGHLKSQSWVGNIYYRGIGVPGDMAQSVYWFSRAAEQGDTSTESQLFMLYIYSVDTLPQEDANVVIWNRKAADQGHPSAQLNLGVMYLSGLGVPQDDERAVYWLRRAADDRQTAAQIVLGAMYEVGRGVERDDSKAQEWYSKAFTQASSPSFMRDITHAAQWLRHQAEQGNVFEQFVLAKLYATGIGVTLDVNESIEWYRKAAEQDLARAQFYLGVLYMTQLKETEQSLVLWHKTAAQDDAPAQIALGAAYMKGIGVPQSKIEAIAWWSKASAQGSAEAQSYIDGVNFIEKSNR